MKAFSLFLLVVTGSALLSSIPQAGEASFSPEPHKQAVAANACESLREHFVTQGLRQVDGWGLGFPMEEAMETTEAAMADVDQAGATTNNQEAGVDEADIVKSDGERLFAVAGADLVTARLHDDGVDVLGSVELPFPPQSLLLHGDVVWALGATEGDHGFRAADDSAWPVLSQVSIVEVDVADLTRPRPGERLAIDGQLIGARLSDGVVQLGIVSTPGRFDWQFPAGGEERHQKRAERHNSDIVRDSTIEQWLPSYRLHSEQGLVTESGVFADCSRVVVPAEETGLSTVTLATFAVDEGLDSWETSGTIGEGHTFYSSGERTYIASTRWTEIPLPPQNMQGPQQWAEREITDIHAFGVTPRPRHLASGSVAGTLIGQFALDQHHGTLRVASTVNDWERGLSESMVTNLIQDGDKLEVVGTVAGLGRGEQIYSVRFLGDVGYVVTFRQIDPLYTLDLSDPTAPMVGGELKITGYSSYLHPVGQGRILGVGQEATETGQPLGLQVSLFDVADASRPERLDQIHLPDVQSMVEWDHLAFSYTNGLAFLPITDGSDAANTTMVVEVGDSLDVTVLEGEGPGTDFYSARTVVTDSVIAVVGSERIDVWDRDSYSWLESESFAAGGRR